MISLNNKSKKWKLLSFTILAKILAFVVNLFKKNKITHLFFYSSEQHSRLTSNFYSGHFEHYRYNRVKGKVYTEMREIGQGYSNFEDAKIVAIGGYNDITFHDTRKEFFTIDFDEFKNIREVLNNDKI